MKWFLIGSLSLLCSAVWVRGDAAGDLYTQGMNALANDQYATAAQAFDQIITNYPTSPTIDEVRLRAGYAYLHAGKFTEAIDRLSKETTPSTGPQYRATALFLTALAQFSTAQKSTDTTEASHSFSQAAATLTALIDLVTSAPTSDNRSYLEQALYYRALSEFEMENFADAEKDLLQLIQSPSFSGSLSRPDYYLRLGSVYSVEANRALAAKKSPAEIRAVADKAIDAFDHVSRDPNALVQANEANMGKAGVLFLVAQVDPSSDGYQKALDAFRQVRRKADMISLQEKRVQDLKAASQAQLQNSTGSLSSDASLLIEREEGRLNELKNGPNPIIQALIGMAQCYDYMKPPQPDEARTILHRLVAHATLTPEQQQDVDFQILYSYVLGGQMDKADSALTAYLGKHAGDPQAESISYQIAAKLMERRDYAGALAQANRSLRDFPQGKYVPDVIAIKAQALSQLGRTAESDQVVADFLKQNPTSPQANSLLLSRAQNETSGGNPAAALADYQTVKDNASAGPELQAAADAGYIQTLQALRRYDEVISESKSFAAKYPDSKSLPGVLVFGGMAMDQKHDPGAVAALQEVARKYPKDATAPFALYYIVNIYQRTRNVPAMIQAAAELRNAYPEQYPLLAQAADAVSTVLIGEKKFDDAIALYQPLINAPKPEIAAAARNKIGSVWLAAAKALGAYQSMQPAMRTEAEKRLSSGEQAYLGTLTTFPDQLSAVGDAFEGLVAALKQRRSWGLLQDADLPGYLAKVGADLTTPEMQARLQMAEAGLVFLAKDGSKQYGEALDPFRKVIAEHPGLPLTRQETDQYGELLLAAKDYPAALKTYGDLLAHTAPTDQPALGDAYYGLGATYLGQGDLVQAKNYFSKLEALSGGGRWNKHILDADYGIALADENSSQPADLEAARQSFAKLMQAIQGGVALQAKAMLGYGRLLEKAGHGVQPTPAGPNEFAIHYYQEPNTIFGPAVPEQSAEGLFDAGQAYEKAGDKANARTQYESVKAYSSSAPDWAAKAQAAEAQLGA